MPLSGGLPERRTFEGETAIATAFTPAGELVYATPHYSTLPDFQLVSLDLGSGERHLIPLSQATEGSFDNSGRALYFVRRANLTPSYPLVHGWHGAADLHIPRRCAGSTEADSRLRRREPHADVVERPCVFRHRPRPHDEPVVDGRERR